MTELRWEENVGGLGWEERVWWVIYVYACIQWSCLHGRICMMTRTNDISTNLKGTKGCQFYTCTYPSRLSYPPPEAKPLTEAWRVLMKLHSHYDNLHLNSFEFILGSHGDL